MQETFYQAYKSINRYNGQCKLSVWLCQIAKHLFYDYLKKQKRYNVVSINDENIKVSFEDAAAGGVEEQLLIKEQAREIYNTALKIKEPYGKVFLLRILGEMSFQEIGAVFEKSDNWARVTYYRAKTKLMEMMKENESDV